MSAFGYHVGHVVQLGALKEMFAVLTWPVVTAMKDVKVGIEMTFLELEGYPMCLDRLTVTPELSVTVGIYLAFPRPTVIWTLDVYLLPESTFVESHATSS